MEWIAPRRASDENMYKPQSRSALSLFLLGLGEGLQLVS